MSTLRFYRQAIVLLAFLFVCSALQAQPTARMRVSELPVVEISTDVSLHIISPEPIAKVDISSHALTGDLLEKNVLRLKVIPDSADLLLGSSSPSVVVTIIAETFIAQYNLCLVPPGLGVVPSLVNILPTHCQPLDVSGIGLSAPDMKIHALALLRKRKSAAIRRAEAYGITARLNQVYTVGDYIFLDLDFQNRTGLSYSIDELRFKIEDRKILKSTNVQSIELRPLWKLYPFASFKHSFHNIYVLKKATFPENKVLNIELSEKQISGRTVSLKVKYGDILNADTL